MNVYTSLSQSQADKTPKVVAIGNFDGVHRGHQQLFSMVIELAKRCNAQATALTFRPHPSKYFRPQMPVFELSKPIQKYNWMRELGMDVVVDLPFDEAMATLSARAFVEDILWGTLGAVHVIVGEGFRFGKGREGTTELLTTMSAHAKKDCTIFKPISEGDELISSTSIRTFVREGQLEKAANLLGRPLEVVGTVIHGDARGRHLGFPTANVDVGDVLMPPSGIYISTLKHDKIRRPACSYIGDRPTFGEGRVTFETFVLDVPKDEALDLYEKEVSIELIEQIREDHAFESSEALIQQMHRDIAVAQDFFINKVP